MAFHHGEEFLLTKPTQFSSFVVMPSVGAKAKASRGELKKDDVQMLTDWAPMFFGIDKSVLEDLVKVANKSLLQNKAGRLGLVGFGLGVLDGFSMAFYGFTMDLLWVYSGFPGVFLGFSLGFFTIVEKDQNQGKANMKLRRAFVSF